MKEKRTLMSAFEYLQENIRILKNVMFDISSKPNESEYAIASLIITLLSNFLKIINEVLLDSSEQKTANAQNDLLEIKAQFNKFIDRMIQ